MSSTSIQKDTPPVIVWFRNDLRVADNGALAKAAESARPVICLYVLDVDRQERAVGGARRWWLHNSLATLDRKLEALGSRLVLRRGDSEVELARIIRQTGAEHIFWNKDHEPAGMARDRALTAKFEKTGITVHSFAGALLHDPARMLTGSGGPYKVYTPFWRAMEALGEPCEPIAAPGTITPYEGDLHSDQLADWKLLPEKPDWAAGLRKTWSPGEDGAHARLKTFIEKGLKGYAENRDRPDLPYATSRLSPHLACGEITPYQMFAATRAVRDKALSRDVLVFRKEIVWREFSWHLLHHFDRLAEDNFNARFDAFPWADDENALKAWQKGQTGYPIVDAGMRQLWQTGWMHNRVRMVVASFLTKHLLIDWRKGEAWFWDTLVDADPASNAASWQWVAGSGADAAPYFRIFNPILQGQKFDPNGDYVRTYVHELEKLDSEFLHRPWEAPPDRLAAAGVTLGKTYPFPLIDHKQARTRALDIYNEIKDAA